MAIFNIKIIPLVSTNLFLKKYLSIRRSVALIMLAVFTLSTLPTRFLHQIFANHTDYVAQTTISDTPQLHVSGLDCHCNSQVVVVPYLISQPDIIVKKENCVSHFLPSKAPEISYSVPENLSLRGPPAIA
jgi:hypothetical protein